MIQKWLVCICLITLTLSSRHKKKEFFFSENEIFTNGGEFGGGEFGRGIRFKVNQSSSQQHRHWAKTMSQSRVYSIGKY